MKYPIEALIIILIAWLMTFTAGYLFGGTYCP